MICSSDRDICRSLEERKIVISTDFSLFLFIDSKLKNNCEGRKKSQFLGSTAKASLLRLSSLKFTLTEKRNLFKECASVLEASNDSIGAYNSMVSYLRLFEGSPESELVENNVGASAKRCVILAVKVPTAINFEEVLELNAIKNLRGVRF